jgi:hypothetical protein
MKRIGDDMQEPTMKDLNVMLNCIHTGVCKCGKPIEADSLYKMSGHCKACSVEIEKELDKIGLEMIRRHYDNQDR